MRREDYQPKTGRNEALLSVMFNILRRRELKDPEGSMSYIEADH